MSDLHARLLAEIQMHDDDAEGFSTVPTLTAALRAVVELHTPFQRSMLTAACRACSTPVHTQPGRYTAVVNWPCSTIRVVAEALGVNDQELIEKEQHDG